MYINSLDFGATLLSKHNSLLLSAEALCFTEYSNQGISLAIHAGEQIGILGAPGSGKTQLLRSLARLDPVLAGRVTWGNVDVTRKACWLLGRQRTYVALILQNPYTFLEPWLRVRKFFDTRPRNQRLGAKKVAEHLQAVGLSPIIQAWRVQNLSGMERVLLALTYALLSAPIVLLLDDVFGTLLPEIWEVLLFHVQKALQPQQALIVASQYGQVLKDVDTVFVLWQGQVVEWGVREAVFSAPYHAYTRELLIHRYGTLAKPNSGWGAVTNTPAAPKAESVEIAPQHWVRVFT